MIRKTRLYRNQASSAYRIIFNMEGQNYNDSWDLMRV
jgi:hypothetical protein